MDYQQYYLDEVYPQLEFPIVNKYPQVTLFKEDGYSSLNEHQVIMLVALTGTGKTTTLDALQDREGQIIQKQAGIIPSRREIADWIVIPTAQSLLDEPIQAISDRVQRFHYTRTFAEHIAGGIATAFSWVNVSTDYQDIILSEGIRGANELTYALSNFPKWHVIELALHPITRLKRLSSRKSDFDKVQGKGNVSFLPDDLQAEVQELIVAGEISESALTITEAESRSYGLFPFADGDQYLNYHQVDVDHKTPDEVARDVSMIMKEITDADN